MRDHASYSARFEQKIRLIFSLFTSKALFDKIRISSISTILHWQKSDLTKAEKERHTHTGIASSKGGLRVQRKKKTFKRPAFDLVGAERSDTPNTFSTNERVVHITPAVS